LASAAATVLGLGSALGVSAADARGIGLIVATLTALGRTSFTTLEPPPVKKNRIYQVGAPVRTLVVQPKPRAPRTSGLCDIPHEEAA
jgi:hypothetical protein